MTNHKGEITLYKIVMIVLITHLCSISLVVKAATLDRIVAIVETDVVLDQELDQEVRVIAKKMKANQMLMPPAMILRKQVLERLILQKLQHQLAQRSGIQVSDEMLQAAIANIVSSNNMSLETFKETLITQALTYAQFEKKVKNDIILDQLRLREISNQIKVSDQEAEHYLETLSGVDDNVSYHLGHILVALPEGANAKEIQLADEKATSIVAQLRTGEDFSLLAIRVSAGNNALTGGDLGWRTIKQMPTVFTDIVPTLKEGDIANPIRSPSGFHVIKVLGLKGVINQDEPHFVTQTKARHILIKTNALMSDEEARKKLLALKQRIVNGDHFSTLARSHSDDNVTALKGGDLGWVTSDVLVPTFEKMINSLESGQISEPIQTSFGWHLIQVIDRKKEEDSKNFGRNQAKMQIRQRKIEEATELWMRRLRSEAFVKIYLERL